MEPHHLSPRAAPGSNQTYVEHGMCLWCRAGPQTDSSPWSNPFPFPSFGIPDLATAPVGLGSALLVTKSQSGWGGHHVRCSPAKADIPSRLCCMQHPLWYVRQTWHLLQPGQGLHCTCSVGPRLPESELHAAHWPGRLPHAA